MQTIRFFLAGDYHSNTGPARATKTLLRYMPADTLYQKMHNKFLRIPEIIWNTIRTDAVIYSGFSRQVMFGIRIARLLKKPTFYLMHGSIEKEKTINNNFNQKFSDEENAILKNVNYILAVSLPFKEWLISTHPEYHKKIYHLTNAVDWDLIKLPTEAVERNEAQIMSIGGGTPLKNVLSICKAVDKLCLENSNYQIQLIVAGIDGDDTNEIQSYPFVKYIGNVTHEQVLMHMRQSTLYIQNSVFESFGLAPLEALLCGCSLLLSRQTGALSIIHSATETDVIQDPYDIKEISNKISNLLACGNQQRLISSVDFETSSPAYRVQELFNLAESLIKNAN